MKIILVFKQTNQLFGFSINTRFKQWDLAMNYCELINESTKTINSINELERLLPIVRDKTEQINDITISFDPDTKEYKQADKDITALIAIEYVIKNNIKALKKPELLGQNIFLYEIQDYLVDAEELDRLAGVHIQIKDQTAEIKWLGSYNTKGSQLLKKALEIAKEKNAKHLIATAKWGSEGFYQKMGMQAIEPTREDPLAGTTFTKMAGKI